MNVIKKIDFWQDYYPAFLLCEQLNTNGVTGWYLPAIEELNKIGNLNLTNNLWSSTEKDANNSYYRRNSYNWDLKNIIILYMLFISFNELC